MFRQDAWDYYDELRHDLQNILIKKQAVLPVTTCLYSAFHTLPEYAEFSLFCDALPATKLVP